MEEIDRLLSTIELDEYTIKEARGRMGTNKYGVKVRAFCLQLQGSYPIYNPAEHLFSRSLGLGFLGKFRAMWKAC